MPTAVRPDSQIPHPVAGRMSLAALRGGIEALAWLTVCALFVVLMAQGSSNGFGIFHQPDSGLVVPLVVGGLINAATFWLHAFVVLPRLQATGAWPVYAAQAAGLWLANTAAQVLTQALIVVTLEPHLAGAGPVALLAENWLMPGVVLAASAAYRFGRDWLGHLRERNALGGRLAAMESELRLVREDVQAGPRTVWLRFGSGRDQIQLPAAAIRYLKAAGNYVEVVSAERTHLVYGSLKAIMPALPARGFVQIHRSYVVNLDQVTRVSGRRVEVGGEALPLGAAHRQAFQAVWDDRGAT